MTSESKSVPHSTGEDRAQYGIARARNQAFSEVIKLWRKRGADGMTQAEFAEGLRRDTGWLSKRLKGPSNITLKTFARMVEALDGEIDIRVHDLRAPSPFQDNFDAYAREEDQRASNTGFSTNDDEQSRMRGLVNAD